MFSKLIIIFSFKFINYFINYYNNNNNNNNNNNISYTGISPSATCALGLPSTQEAAPAHRTGQTARQGAAV
jgi:hypothetical protein